MIPVLTAMRAYSIITGNDPEPQPLNLDNKDNYDDWKAMEAETTSTLRPSCSPEVWRIVKGIRNYHEMWNVLESSLVTAGLYIGREDMLPQFRGWRPKENEPVKTDFTKLSNYHIQLDHTDDAITDPDFRTQLFTAVPSQYVMVLMVLSIQGLYLHPTKPCMIS